MESGFRKCIRSGGDGQSGQVMVEACMGLALMVFAWTLITFSTFMDTNHIRTAMASRHAAWSVGNGRAKDKESLKTEMNTRFFYAGAPVEVDFPDATPGSPEGLGSLINFLSPEPPTVVKIKFGMSMAEARNTTDFPFNLMKTRAPFMTEDSMMEGWLSVDSQCAWEQVNETWSRQELKDKLGPVAGPLMSVLGL